MNDNVPLKRQIKTYIVSHTSLPSVLIHRTMAVLSMETQRIVADIRTEVNSEEPEPPNGLTTDDTRDDEMEWETLPNELNGDQLFLHSMHDMLSTRCVSFSPLLTCL